MRDSFFTIYDTRNTIYEFMADAVATNANRRQNNCTHQNAAYLSILFISKTIPKGTQLRLLGMSYKQIAKSLNINKRIVIRTGKYGRRQSYVLARIFPSLRGTKSSVCHCESAEGRRGNLCIPKKNMYGPKSEFYTKLKKLYCLTMA